MAQQIIIQQELHQMQAAIVEDGRLAEYYLQQDDDETHVYMFMPLQRFGASRYLFAAKSHLYRGWSGVAFEYPHHLIRCPALDYLPDGR